LCISRLCVGGNTQDGDQKRGCKMQVEVVFHGTSLSCAIEVHYFVLTEADLSGSSSIVSLPLTY
jgi:hypothetical protein